MDEPELEPEPEPEPEDDKSSSEAKQRKDVGQKKRRYAPVTVSENESCIAEDGKGEEGAEDGFTEVAEPPSHHGRKRKRTSDSSLDGLVVEADDPAIAPTLPQIQRQGQHVDNCQVGVPGRHDSPAASNHPQDPASPDPSLPHTITDDEGQGAKRKKAAPSRALKALQMAKAEAPNFINNDSGDEVPVGKRHKIAAGDGKKPTAAKEDPVFDVIYKNAVLELKRQIYFVNAFPTSTESDNLARKAYNHSVDSVTKSKLFSEDDLRGASKAFDGNWFSCLNHQISSLRTQLKTTTLNKVNAHFGKLTDQGRKNLVEANQYWYEVSPMGEANLERPFLNEAIIDVLKERYFRGKKSLYRLFPVEFPQSLVAEDGGRGPEIPPRLVALVATFVYYALANDGKSSENWKYESFNRVYDGHLAEFKKIQGDNPQCYHLILNKLFSNCVGDAAPALGRPTVSKSDYRGLDPAKL